MLKGVDVNLVMHMLGRRRQTLRRQLDVVLATDQQLAIGHPHHMRVKRFSQLRGVVLRWIDQHIAAADVNLISQGQSHRLAWPSALDLALRSQNPLDHTLAMRGQHFNRLTDGNRTGGNGAGETAEIRTLAIDVLNGQPKTHLRLPGLHRMAHVTGPRRL